MIAYLHKTKTGYELTICNAPCGGAEYQAGEKIAVTGKREANKICKARGLKAWNW
jgi:hypothetical protein